MPYVGMALYWSTFYFPLHNFVRYRRVHNSADNNPKSANFMPGVTKGKKYQAGKTSAEEHFMKVEELIGMDEKERKKWGWKVKEIESGGKTKYHLLQYDS